MEVLNIDKHKPRKVVAFYRLSKINTTLLKQYSHAKRVKIRIQLREEAFDVQKDQVRRVIEDLNYKLIAEYKAIIGRSKIATSLEFIDALEHAIKEKADLMVSTFDRIGEEIYFTFEVKERLKRLGLNLLFADYLEADDLIIAVKIAISKKERELICKRQKAKADLVKRFGSRSGKPHGNPHFKTGAFKREYDRYRRQNWEVRKRNALRNRINQNNAAYIIEAKKAGKTFKEIAEKLKQMGRLTVTGREINARIARRICDHYWIHYENGFKYTG